MLSFHTGSFPNNSTVVLYGDLRVHQVRRYRTNCKRKMKGLENKGVTSVLNLKEGGWYGIESIHGIMLNIETDLYETHRNMMC